MNLFDLHCDSITEYKKLSSDFMCSDTQFSLRELGKFDRLCQTMAIFVPDGFRGEAALTYFNQHLEYLKKLTASQSDLAEIAMSAGDIERINSEKKAALIIAIEGGAALAGELKNIDYIRDCGVRMMTLVWNGANEIASGHDTDQGFTEFGRLAVKKLEANDIILDVSHLNDRGFEEICEMAQKPFVASHSNLREICSHRRNLTRMQFKEIIRRKGLVGVNLYEAFLSDDGTGDKDSAYRHISRMLELGGEDIIACGSDFDGADIHESLDTPVKFARLSEYLLQRGISEKTVDKIFFENAMTFFKSNLA